MDEQLALMGPEEPAWRLDERTRRLGLQGVQAARSALRRSGTKGPEGRGPAPSPTTRAA